jgi:hypothetical protein
MRIFPWINHPFSYQFNEKRKKIKEHNFQRLHANWTSYKESYQNLREETGVLLLHINPTDHVRKTITIVDKTLAEYEVSLDRVTFILQQRAELIYPTLDRLLTEKKIDEAKQVISRIIQLITTRCQKGYMDDDADLRKNYGLLKDRAIHIDIGDLFLREGISLRENYIPHIKEMTECLRQKLESLSPELLDHYIQEIESL